MVDHDAVVAAARDLDIRPRSKRWAHASLCVLDAVFSIGARYASTVRTCERYAEHAVSYRWSTQQPRVRSSAHRPNNR